MSLTSDYSIFLGVQKSSIQPLLIPSGAIGLGHTSTSNPQVHKAGSIARLSEAVLRRRANSCLLDDCSGGKSITGCVRPLPTGGLPITKSNRPLIRNGDLSDHVATSSKGCEPGAVVFPGSSAGWCHNSHGRLVPTTELHSRPGSLVTTSSDESWRLVRRRTWLTILLSTIAKITYEYYRQVRATAAGVGGRKIRPLQQNTGTGPGVSDTDG